MTHSITEKDEHIYLNLCEYLEDTTQSFINVFSKQIIRNNK